MTRLREMLPNDTFVDDDGDIKPYADVAPGLDFHPVSDASIAQGMTNLEKWREEQSTVEQGEAALRRDRELAVSTEALKNAGVYVTLEEHAQNQRELVDIAANISMYRGGEKGGYNTDDFQQRYVPKAADVEAGARKNHKKAVNYDLPRIYKAKELKEAGFSPYDVDDDVVQMRSQLLSRYGGPANKKARATWRAELKRK